jgi:hypothetical protein
MSGGTLDFIEDAVDDLTANGQSYLLFVIRGEKTLTDTFLNDEDRKTLQMWIDTGHWNRLLQMRLDKHKPNTTMSEETHIPPHQKRVIDEKTDLDDKIEKLGIFIKDSPIFKSLDEDERCRLQRQWMIMVEYSSILGERIAAF